LVLALKETRENVIGPFEPSPSLFLSASGESAKFEIFPDRHPGEEAAPLRDESDAAFDNPLGWLHGDGVALPSDRPGAWYQEASNRLEEGRFPGSVGTDQGDHLSGADRETNPMQRRKLAIGNFKTLHLKHEFHSKY
jgi:hypothetical protein